MQSEVLEGDMAELVLNESVEDLEGCGWRGEDFLF